MTEPNRPHCRTPEACTAKSEKHCRACTMRVIQAKRFEDPAEREALRQRMLRFNRDPEMRGRMMETLKHNKSAMAALRKSARQKARRLNQNADVMARRADAVRASSGKKSATMASKLAAEVGIPIDLIPVYRRVRRKNHMRRDEAVALLRSSYPAAFVEIDAKARAAALRELGPTPAIGMPDRAAWTQRANAIRAGVRG